MHSILQQGIYIGKGKSPYFLSENWAFLYSPGLKFHIDEGLSLITGYISAVTKSQL